jgi:hypothetical protein
MTAGLDDPVIIAAVTTVAGELAGPLLTGGYGPPVAVRGEAAGQSPGGLAQKLLDDGLGQPGVVALRGPVAVPA